MVDCFLKSHTNLENAQAMADLLVEADYRGHYSHGMNRLEMYINDLHKNSTDGMTKPKILNETPATAWVDGKNGLGAVVGNFCMDLAIDKAKKTGVGVVCARSEIFYSLCLYVVTIRTLIFLFYFRIQSLWNRRLVHNPCNECRNDWNVIYEYVTTDVSHSSNGSWSWNKSNFIRCTCR